MNELVTDIENVVVLVTLVSHAMKLWRMMQLVLLVVVDMAQMRMMELVLMEVVMNAVVEVVAAIVLVKCADDILVLVMEIWCPYNGLL